MKKNINTLVFGVNWFGDTLMSLPFYEILKSESPDNSVTAIIHERVKGLFDNNPNIDQLHTVNKRLSFLYLLKLLPLIKAAKAQTVYLLRPSNSQVIICRMAGIKNIICHDIKKTSLWGAKTIPFPKTTHRMDVYLSLLERDISSKEKKMKIYLNDDENKFGHDLYHQLASNGKPLVVIHPMANWDLKRWPLKYYAKLADRLINQLNVNLVITGTKDDCVLSNQITKLMSNQAYDLCGKLSIRELAAFIAKVDLFISADTGIMHLCAAVGTPLIGLFGPTDEILTGPRSSNRVELMRDPRFDCQLPCYKLDCEDNHCMKLISVDDVFKKAVEVLNGR